MKTLAMLAATGLISALPAVASARPHFTFGFGFNVPVPFIPVPPCVEYAPPPVCVPAPVVTYDQYQYVPPAPVYVAPPQVYYAPAPACNYSYSYYCAPRYWDRHECYEEHERFEGRERYEGHRGWR